MICEIERFLTHLQEDEDLTAHTMANYRCNLRLFEQWLESQGKTLPTLTQTDMKQYREQLKAKYKPSTINKKLAYVSMLCQWCQKSGLISNNPMTRIKGVKSEKYPKWIEQEQVAMILEEAQKAVESAQNRRLAFSLTISLKMQAIAILLLNTGLRVSELCDLKFSDINNEVITVRWGKGSKRREIPMNDQAERAIQTWLEVRQSESDYIFATPKGRMTRQVVQWHLSLLGQRVGVHLTPHLLRHTFGKRLADKGIALDRIAKLMGHSNINTTAIYTMPSLHDLKQVVKLLD